MFRTQAEVCWVCLGESTCLEPLCYPCKCPRPVHGACLARWQLHSAGSRSVIAPLQKPLLLLAGLENRDLNSTLCPPRMLGHAVLVTQPGVQLLFSSLLCPLAQARALLGSSTIMCTTMYMVVICAGDH